MVTPRMVSRKFLDVKGLEVLCHQIDTELLCRTYRCIPPLTNGVTREIACEIPWHTLNRHYHAPFLAAHEDVEGFHEAVFAWAVKEYPSWQIENREFNLLFSARIPLQEDNEDIWKLIDGNAPFDLFQLVKAGWHTTEANSDTGNFSFFFDDGSRDNRIDARVEDGELTLWSYSDRDFGSKDFKMTVRSLDWAIERVK